MLNDQAYAKGQKDLVDIGCSQYPFDQRIKNKPTSRKAEHDDCWHGDQWINPPYFEEPERTIGPQHDELTMREVNNTGHSKRQREANRHQRIQPTEQSRIN